MTGIQDISAVLKLFQNFIHTHPHHDKTDTLWKYEERDKTKPLAAFGVLFFVVFATKL